MVTGAAASAWLVAISSTAYLQPEPQMCYSWLSQEAFPCVSVHVCGHALARFQGGNHRVDMDAATHNLTSQRRRF